MEQIIAHGSNLTNISRSNFFLFFRKLHESHFLFLAWGQISAKLGQRKLFALSKLARLIDLKPFPKLDIIHMDWVRSPIVKYLT
jgi:hypothetical protein